MTQKVRASTAAILALAVVQAGCARRAPQPRPAGRPPASAAVGQTLTLEAPALDGAHVLIAPASGKVRVVDLWASWCEPCRRALPHLDELARDLGHRGLEVFGVALDDERDEVTAFLAEVPVGFPVLWDRSGERASAARLPITRLPTTLVLDRSSVIHFVHEGWTEAVAREQRRQVEALLRE